MRLLVIARKRLDERLINDQAAATPVSDRE